MAEWLVLFTSYFVPNSLKRIAGLCCRKNNVRAIGSFADETVVHVPAGALDEKVTFVMYIESFRVGEGMALSAIGISNENSGAVFQ